MIRILIPTALRAFTGDHASVEVEAATVGEALGRLVLRHGELRRHLYDDQGRLRSFVNVYRNDEDCRFLERDRTALAPGDVLAIVPAIAGGGAT
jgi:molybdopterin converting factor small subunit